MARIVISTVQLRLQLFSNYAQQNSSTLYLGIIESVCATCSTPRLNLSSELRPFWNNIQDTFLTGPATDTTTSPSIQLDESSLIYYLFKIQVNITLPSATRSSYCTFSFRSTHQSPVYISLLPCTCKTPLPSHPLTLYHPNNIWWRVQIAKLLSVHCAILSTLLSLHTSKAQIFFLVTLYSEDLTQLPTYYASKVRCWCKIYNTQTYTSYSKLLTE